MLSFTDRCVNTAEFDRWCRFSEHFLDVQFRMQRFVSLGLTALGEIVLVLRCLCTVHRN